MALIGAATTGEQRWRHIRTAPVHVRRSARPVAGALNRSYSPIEPPWERAAAQLIGCDPRRGIRSLDCLGPIKVTQYKRRLRWRPLAGRARALAIIELVHYKQKRAIIGVGKCLWRLPLWSPRFGGAGSTGPARPRCSRSHSASSKYNESGSSSSS